MGFNKMKKFFFFIALTSFLWGFPVRAQDANQPIDTDYFLRGGIGMQQAAWSDPLENMGEGQTQARLFQI